MAQQHTEPLPDRDEVQRAMKTGPAAGPNTNSGHKHQQEFDMPDGLRVKTAMVCPGPILPVPKHELPPSFPTLLKRHIHYHLNLAILLCDVIPDGKMSELCSF
jgi:hypothetical protein